MQWTRWTQWKERVAGSFGPFSFRGAACLAPAVTYGTRFIGLPGPGLVPVHPPPLARRHCSVGSPTARTGSGGGELPGWQGLAGAGRGLMRVG
ncbi:hypothetical protein SSP531S_57740 [Streptomyces spongiicola]|uniref:Uncharacterized protein n=1 Tax=Streptomyces spongiicola TaxID=1690221 RepID=A0A388T7K7_9ACTN|nr:hypothetical protein SSP531S_57740 [Streptomyces spongiicola]